MAVTRCLTLAQLTAHEFVPPSYHVFRTLAYNFVQEEIQHMRSSNDPITGLKNMILEWNLVSEAELKQIDKDARQEVEVAVEEAKKSPEPRQDVEMWTDIYYNGTNPAWMRGREREEVCQVFSHDRQSAC